MRLFPENIDDLLVFPVNFRNLNVFNVATWERLKPRPTKEEPQKLPSGHAVLCDIGFLFGFHHDVDRLCIEIEVTSSYDIFFQQCKTSCYSDTNFQCRIDIR